MSEAAHSTPIHLRLAAGLIGCAALLEVVLVTHHPVVSHAEQVTDIFSGLAAIVQTNLAFHSVVMLVAVGQLLGLLLFARRLGLGRPLVLIGMVCCCLAAALLVIAMTFDGFVVYELISRCRASAAGCTNETADALGLVSAIIQGFTKLGFAAQCLGFIALSVAAWSLGGKARIGVAVSVIAAATPVLILTSGSYVGPQQLTQILALLAGWGLCVSSVLVLRSFQRLDRNISAERRP